MEPYDDRHEQGDPENGIEDREGSDHALGKNRDDDTRESGSHRGGARHPEDRTVVGAGPQEAVEDVARKRRGEHEEHRIRARHFR